MTDLSADLPHDLNKVAQYFNCDPQDVAMAVKNGATTYNHVYMYITKGIKQSDRPKVSQVKPMKKQNTSQAKIINPDGADFVRVISRKERRRMESKKRRGKLK